MKNLDNREKRLKQFSEHLKKGKLLGEGKYNKFFEKVLQNCNNQNGSNDEPIYLLPIFELPYIFDSWVFNKEGLPIYVENREEDTICSFLEFFSINTTQFRHLFIKHWQLVDLYGGKDLSDEPSPNDLANNIDELIKHINHYSALDSFNYKIYLN